MSRKKKLSNRASVRMDIETLKPIAKALRPSLREAFDRVSKYAVAGARGFDYLGQEQGHKPKIRKPKGDKAKKKGGPSHQLREPGPIERRDKKWVNPGLPNNLNHIPLEERDLARLELLRAFHDGPEAFVAKREELMKRFKIDQHQKRELIMGAFWGHLNGHRRKQFVARMIALKGGRRYKILTELAQLYRMPRTKLTLEVDASPTIH